jgi:hypothetical protein
LNEILLLKNFKRFFFVLSFVKVYNIIQWPITASLLLSKITVLVGDSDDGNGHVELARCGSLKVGGQRTVVDGRKVDEGATKIDPAKIVSF